MSRPLITLLLGLALGAALGLYLGWVVFPVQLVDVVPGDLDPKYQEDYLELTAATFAEDQNLVLARQRLNTINGGDWQAWLLEQTIDAILAAPAAPETAELVALATALGIDSPAFAPYQTPVENNS